MGGGAGQTDSASTSYSFLSQIMHNNEIYDLVEELGSVGRYKNRATGEYRDFMDYKLRPNTTTRVMDN